MKVTTAALSRVSQGDIIRDVEYVEHVGEKAGQIEISKILFPLVVVLSQDCDLEQDFRFRWSRHRTPDKHDKYLLSVLAVPLYNAEEFFAGTHLSDLGQQMLPINRTKTPGKNITQNETPRYHYFDFPATVPVVPSVADFKHYFTVNVRYLKRLKKTNYICRLSPLFREDVSLRFSNYLARIGLPETQVRPSPAIVVAGPAPAPVAGPAAHRP
jgi:hypothetical protein